MGEPDGASDAPKESETPAAEGPRAAAEAKGATAAKGAAKASTPEEAAAARKKQRRIILGLVLFGVVGGVVLLAVLEVGLRASGVEPHGYVLVNDETCYYGWGAGVYDRSENQSRSMTHTLWTDDEGFRVTENQTRKADKCRILALGDSFTHGFFVEAQEAYPAVLEGMLHDGGLSVRVDNGGMPGNTIAEERVGALGRWAHLEPDVVIIGQTSNDLEDLLLLKRRGCRLDGPAPTTFAPALPANFNTLAIARLSQDIAAKLETLSPKMNSVRQRSGTLDPPASLEECAAIKAEYTDLALDLTRTMQAKNKHVLFFTHDNFACGPDHGEGFMPELGKKLTEAGAKVVRATDITSKPENSLRPKDSHPNAKGHREYAKRLTEELTATGWLSTCR